MTRERIILLLNCQSGLGGSFENLLVGSELNEKNAEFGIFRMEGYHLDYLNAGINVADGAGYVVGKGHGRDSVKVVRVSA